MDARHQIDGRTVESDRRKAPKEKPEQIAGELRELIVSGEYRDGDSLGREPELIARFGVSRPSLREAMRILETEGLIRVVRGLGGGVVVRQPNERNTARTASLVLRSRNVPLSDVYGARVFFEAPAARAIAESSTRHVAAAELSDLIARQEASIDDPEEFARVNTAFHQRLVTLTGNETLAVVAEMLNEIVTSAVRTVSRHRGETPAAVRRRGLRSQRKLVELIEAGDGDASEAHWRTHMHAVGRALLGEQATMVVETLER